MNCSDVLTHLHGYVDQELDLVRQVEIEGHLRSCDACARAYRAAMALRAALKSDDLYFKAPAHLERRIRMEVLRPEKTSWRPRLSALGWIGAATAAAAVLVLGVLVGPTLQRPSPTERAAEDVVSAHVRSLQPGHLTDVASSEQHTVKPWFAGRLDFSPVVVDLADEGYPLVGGRLDYAAHRSVAALAYRRGAHLINLFVWPSTSPREAAETADVRQGYNLLHWTHGRTDFWAVSDLNAAELRQFARLVQDRAASGPTARDVAPVTRSP